MEQIISIVKAVAVLAVFMAIGFAAAKTGYIKRDVALSLSGFITRLMHPAWAVARLLSPDVTKEQMLSLLPLLLAGAIITLSLDGVGWLVAKIMKVDNKRKYTLLPLFSAPNCVFFGVPICQSLFGDYGALCCTIAALGSDLISWTVTISLMNRGAMKEFEGEGEKPKFHLTPVTVAFVISFILKMFDFSLPEIMLSPIAKFGDALAYSAMIYLGILLCGISLKGLFKEKIVYVHLTLKCLVLPFLIGIIAGLVGFDAVQAGTLTIIFAASPMISMNLFYKSLGLDYKLGSSLTFTCVLINIVTIPFAYWLVSTAGAVMGIF